MNRDRTFEFNRFIRGKLRHFLYWGALCLIPPLVKSPPQIGGIALIFAGAAIRALASGYLEKESRLTVSGPYAYVRNPLYLGTNIMICGVAASEDAWFAFGAAFAAGMFLTYFLVRAEELVLSEKFPDHFPAYTAAVPRFFPVSIRPLKIPGSRFSKALFMKNRGYEALLTGIGLVALLDLIHFAKTSIEAYLSGP
jgi:hypothetical protein